MIHEQSQLVRKIDHQFQHDAFYPNPNPNPHILLTHHGFFNWSDASTTPPFPLPQQVTHRKKDLASPSAPGLRFKAKTPVPQQPPEIVTASTTVPAATSTAVSNTMRDPSTRTKVVIRHLPPALSQSTFMEQIESRFSGSYNMITFYPGKSSVRRSTYTRVYIDFKQPESVFDFHQAFDGHVFVNEKGTQYKAIVEYAPNQRVPKQWAKKDQREGTLLQDPEYLKFVEMLSKPIEYLPSAEVQLERKEAERSSNLAAGIKEPVVITPLMQFVRQKRAMKQMPQKLLSGSGKISIRGSGSSPTSSSKLITKRGSERARSTTMYSPGSRSKEKTAYVPRTDDKDPVDKKTRTILEKKVPSDSARKISNNQSPNSALADDGVEQPIIHVLKKESVLISQGSVNDATTGANLPRGRAGSLKSPVGSLSNADESLLSKPSQGGRIPRGVSARTPVLLQKGDQQNDKDKRVARSQVWRSNGKDNNGSPSELDSNSLQQHHYSPTNFTDDKSDGGRQDGRRLRNKDRPDRPVWTVRRRGDAANSDSPTSVGAVPSQSPPGSQRHVRGGKDSDNNGAQDLGKPTTKRIGSSVTYGGHEKQVWVAKPGSGS